MKTWLTTFALCTAVPLVLDSATLPCPSNPIPPTPEPNFEVIEPAHARAYVERIYPLAVQLEEQCGMPIPVSLGIACLESGYGRSHYAQKRNNHLGIRSYQGGQAGYRHFSSVEACFDYFGQLLSKERYAPLQAIEANDLAAYLAGLQACGFNHRDSYTQKMHTIIRFLNLEQVVPQEVA